MRDDSGRRRRLIGAAVAAPLCALLLGAQGTAAAGAPEPTAAETTTVGNATMGSQIREHEGAGDQRIALTPSIQATVPGIDVASYQGNVNWKAQWNAGKRFAYVKATEGTGYKNPYHTQQYNGSYNVGMIRGSYHFALPNRASGAAQANYFVSNGGGWSKDGKTLPGALDMEYNPYGATCYGLSKAAMGNWIRAFSNTYRSKTGRYPVIYTSTSWWNQCVSGSFGSTNPLWVARYSSSVGALPAGWNVHTFWQYTSTPLDQNRFNGAMDRLRALANG